MRTGLLTLPIVLAAGLAVSSLAFAQAPAGSTGACKDGSYTSQATKRGACKGHGGVKEWYASEAKSKEKASEEKAPKDSKKESKKEKASEAAAAGGAAGAAATAPAQTSSMASSHKTPKGMRAEAAPGGGAGKVWVNTASHVYHCSGDEWYGKTKEGEYMTEAEAKAKGAHASHGKACS
jgi:hypothetical protein